MYKYVSHINLPHMVVVERAIVINCHPNPSLQAGRACLTVVLNAPLLISDEYSLFVGPGVDIMMASCRDESRVTTGDVESAEDSSDVTGSICAIYSLHDCW